VLNKLAELSFYRWQDRPPEDPKEAKMTRRGLIGAKPSQKLVLK
jgi:hypothetical protein